MENNQNTHESQQYPRIKDEKPEEMVVTPTNEYTWTELEAWFAQAQKEGKVLVLVPCNPMDVPFLYTKATIRTRDDMAVLSQWLGGIKA